MLRDYLPELGPAEDAALARLADGSIGRALELAGEGGLELYREIVELLAALAGARHRSGCMRFADALGRARRGGGLAHRERSCSTTGSRAVARAAAGGRGAEHSAPATGA